MSATQPSKLTKPAWNPDEIPPFPAVALKALNLMAGTDTSLIDLCNLVRADPAFSAEILRVANSPLVAFSKHINSMLQASMLLGFRRLKNVVITVGLRAYLKKEFGPLLQSCWRHSVASAIIAERTAHACGYDKDAAYTAGIMHDIGRIALAVAMPQMYAQVAGVGAGLPRDLLSIERALCGVDHCEAGGTLIDLWSLPGIFHEVTTCHHNASTALSGEISLVPPSCLLADSLGFAVAPYPALGVYPDIICQFPEPARGKFPACADELISTVTNEIRLIESC